MSGPTPTGNSCSLEDCYTNIFALTDISGIKWKKLCIDPVQANIDPFEDPVLSSYSKCLQADILCVWKRTIKHSESRPTDFSFGKELWIFWYGDEPFGLQNILSPQLKEHESGSWDKDSVLSYECRTLLFKALHNLIERCLITKDFIRLGKWFVMPQDPGAGMEQSNLSFCFNFFLHGESTVCASIEVKQHPPVMYLNNTHLNQLQESQSQLQVILAPYGLNGMLTGVTYRDSDQVTRKHLDEWKQFYPVRTNEAKDTDMNVLPNLVEVVVAGVRMKYPSCFVLLVDEHRQRPPVLGDHGPLPRQGMMHQPGVGPHGPLTPPTSPEDALHASPMYHNRPLERISDLTTRTNGLLSSRLVERVHQDNCFTAGLSKVHSEGLMEDALTTTWAFAEPTSKINCNCPRTKASKNKPNINLPGKPIDKKKGDKQERQNSRFFRTTPFHQRPQSVEDFMHHDMDTFMPRGPPSNTGCVGNSLGTQVGSGGGAAVQPVGTSDTVNINSVGLESPASIAPSPLEESHHQNQLENGTSMDPTMPTHSPHPPVLKHAEKDSGLSKHYVQSDQNTSATTNNSANIVTNSMVNGMTSDSGVFHKSVLKTDNLSLNNVAYSWSQPVLENTKANNINSWLRSQQKQVDYSKSFKRPILPTLDGDEDELNTEALYNFDPVHNWSDFPLKKVCYERTEHLNGLQDARFSSNNLGQNHKPFKPPTPQPPAPDPYAFSDESSSTPATISRGSMRNSREDMFQKPFKEEESADPTRTNNDQFEFKQERNSLDFGPVTSPPSTPGTQAGGSLTRTVDLIPQKSDLDNLFDTDSDSNDDAFIPHSPMGSKGMEDIKSLKPTSTGPVDVIAQSELSRMYPTPPSLENNPALSPMTSIDSHMDTTVMEGITYTAIKTEVVVGSLTGELSKDGMSVFKPDACAHFPSSSKYAPVDLYSSQLSPPPDVPDYKPSWQYGMSIMDHKPHGPISHYMNIPSIENLPSIPSARMPSSAIEASPAAFQNSVGQQKTPLSYELQSPASNASSYLKTPNSNLNHHIGTNNQIAEAQSLFVNIVLSDTLLNLFKDHSFDNCNMCVCNMTIKGADLGLYIPNPTGEQEYKCTCGFSAVLNKRHGVNSGLFYEDEVDITGVRDERFEARKPSLLTVDCTKVDESGNKVSTVEEVSQVVLQLILSQYSVPYPTCSTVSLLKKIDMRLMSCPSSTVNISQLSDGNEVTYGALDQGRQAMEHCHPNKLEDNMMKSTCLHKWSQLQGPSLIPQNSVDCVRLLKSLQPFLQDAIHNKRVTRLWEHTYKLQGPLTWIEFHQLAGRGTDESSEPQPIPSILVGCEKDSANVSPFAVKFWDKNLLEPYGSRRDIAYVIVTPDNDFLMNGVRSFFKELSTVYEWSRLGRHCPVSDKLRDGILRVGKVTSEKVGDLECDEWFKYIGDGDLAAKLRLYAKACKHQLAPFLAQQDPKTIFASSKSSQRASHHRPPEMSVNSDNLNNSSSEERESGQNESGQRDYHDDLQDNHECPAIVIYLINPFTYAQDWDDLNRLAVIGLLKCYQEIVPKLPELMQSNIYLQIVPLQTIVDFKDSSTQFQLLKNIAFSVFTSCRWNLTHSVLGRSLTGFGPAAAADAILKRGTSSFTYKLYSPPFVLAPLKDKQSQLTESCNEKKDDSTILMCVYCLSEDQRWLIACCTDERGETIETCTINVDIPNRNRRKKTSARKIGLSKLWEFIQGVVSMSSKPCRIVIGRFGRIGHGELKGWSGLLSKKNIQQCSKRMREMCSQCSYQTNGDYPYIVSACLTSIEQQNSFLILPDAVNPEEKKEKQRNCPLQTPRDCSCSHILVFPTSATAQANTNQIQLDSTGGIDLGGHNLEFGVDLSDFENNNDDFGSLMDVFVSMTNSPPGSPRQDNPGSPGGLMDLGRSSPNKLNGNSMTNPNSLTHDPQDDPNLLQQPLAMGYYLSTAQTGPLPKWFWSACPENEFSAVKCFKSALHVHSSTNQDDFMHQANTRNTHPLDSNLTCDVLRFVLEKYNALSWLTFDPAHNDRKSCLPIHFMVLMQMYHAMNAFV